MYLNFGIALEFAELLRIVASCKFQDITVNFNV